MAFAELKEAIEKMKVVDSHAHSIVPLASSFAFINSLSEATGDALSFAPYSLSFKAMAATLLLLLFFLFFNLINQSRNLREIAEFYGTESSLDAVEQYRRLSGLQAISSKCFKAAGISTILIDDGLKLDKKHDIQWHKNFVPFVGDARSIYLDIGCIHRNIFEKLEVISFQIVIDVCNIANEIVGLKSIAAYRSGLEINPHVTREDAEIGLSEVLQRGKPVRITNKSLIDHIFIHGLEVALQFDLPLQIHTGFGDKDLDLRLANPLHLRTLLEDKRFSRCRIVLLHASYPFSKEASYLASIYPQVYLDFGLAIPKLSFHGMISSVKELLELAPIKKVMFSTDAVATPETYYLGQSKFRSAHIIEWLENDASDCAKRAREVVFSVLRDSCIDHDLSITEAIEASKDIFARTAIQLYKINIGEELVGLKASESPSYVIGTNVPEHSVSLVRILWADASGQHRCRVVPKKRFNDVVRKNGVGLTFACMAMSSAVDGPADETNLTGTGEIRLMPDLSTWREIPWKKQEEMVLADMHLKPGDAWEYCPREALRRVSKVLKDEFNLVRQVVCHAYEFTLN
ncbi:hypothetical protein Gohar_025193 [Gossypium harknessii]|uniref:Amidohydrolase-related domain-containing protein n=1 Tax=Gossypium harknessii TaxID=34285 RepID=A0A7J9HIT6_9ROSI|nr:hypothetical protein [Gossypium harknessii]